MSFSGFDSRELQLFNIATGLAVDFGESGYAVTVEGSGQDTEGPRVTRPSVTRGEGETVTRCLSDIRKKEGRYPYLRHSVLLLISEEAAEHSLENLMEYVINEHNVRMSTYVAITEGEAGALFTEEEYASSRIVRSLSHGSTTVTTSDVMLAELIYDIYSPGIDAFLPIVNAGETEGLVFMSGFKPAGKLDSRLTPAFLMAKDMARAGNITVEIKGRPVSFRLTDCKGKRNVTVEGGRALLEIDVMVRFRAEDRPGSVTEAEQALKERLEADMAEMLSLLRESGSDALGFGQLLYRRQNALWRDIEGDWARLYADSAVRISVKAEVDAPLGEEKE